MNQIKAILANFMECGSIKKTSRQLKVSRNTVKRYLSRAKESGKSLEALLAMDDSDLRKIFYRAAAEKEATRLDYFNAQLPYWLTELRRVGVTRQLLWEEYRSNQEHGYGYSQFCERLNAVVKHKDLSINLKHKAGQVMQLDYAGKHLSWIDPLTGEVHDCEVLVAVMPHSQYTFAIALPSQKIADFVHGINQALCYFGVLPEIILSDNLKSFVKRIDKYEPKFTELCEQLGAHYQVELQAARVRKPKDKASVESAVGIIYKRIYAPLRDQEFHSLRDLNTAIRSWLDQHNERGFQKKAGSRKSVFDAFERPEMRLLPSALFEVKKMTLAMVQRNYHIMLGEDKDFYSVPYQYVGKKAQVIYTQHYVEVYIENQRIAFHVRMPKGGDYRYRTEDKHEPRNHQEWKQARGYNGAYFLKEADKIGPATHWAISFILKRTIKQSQSFNSCKGVLHLVQKYTAVRVELAALRCKPAEHVNYTMLKNILKANLDQVPMDEEPPIKIPFHDNLRGSGNYQ